MHNRLNLSLAAFPALSTRQAWDQALALAAAGELHEPYHGAVHLDHVQLVPQNFGALTRDLIVELRARRPATRFRLHANVRVLPRHVLVDLSNLDRHPEWLAAAAGLQALLDGEPLSLHSGRRANADLATMFDNARRAADVLGAPVAIEGQYPANDAPWLVDSWEDYAQVLRSGLPFALDLSHLNILARRSRRRELGLVREMLASDCCFEVHLSDNDGTNDQHQVIDRPLWWHAALPALHPCAVVFTEGNHLRYRKDLHAH